MLIGIKIIAGILETISLKMNRKFCNLHIACKMQNHANSSFSYNFLSMLIEFVIIRKAFTTSKRKIRSTYSIFCLFSCMLIEFFVIFHKAFFTRK